MSESIDKEKVMTRKNITSLAFVVVIGLLFQAGFIALDSKNTPADAAVSFVRAYYRQSPSVTQWMCGTSSATCGKCVCGSESVNCPKAVSGHDPANCSKAAPVNESANCPKTTSGDESTICPKAASGDKSVTCSQANCVNESINCSKAGCSKVLARRVNNAVENYFYEAGTDAAERGFGKNYAKYSLSHIDTRTEYLDDATALVHLTGHRRLAINPLYAYVARLFRIGEPYEVDESIQVKLEDGRWRVCESSLLSLTS